MEGGRDGQTDRETEETRERGRARQNFGFFGGGGERERVAMMRKQVSDDGMLQLLFLKKFEQ